MLISAIVSNFNGARFLPRLIETLRAQQDVDLEIVVVDRESSDNSLEILKTYAEVMVISEPPQSGLVAGYAAGVKVARGECYFFCNEDMWFEDRCLFFLADRISLAERVGASDPWQWTYDGTELVHKGTRFTKSHWNVHSPFPFRSFEFLADLPAGAAIPFACAGAFLIHREMYSEIGGWDTTFFLSHEDLDLFLRGWQRGWNTVVVPEAKVYHAVGSSSPQTAQTRRKRKVTVGEKRYISAFASTSIIPIKYFSFPSLLLAVPVWFVRLLNNGAKFRPRAVWLDLLVLSQILQRLPGAVRYRIGHRELNSAKPGEDFFRDSAFQALPVDR